MEKSFGIWMDSDTAYIIDAKSESITEVKSNVDHYNTKGGYGGSKAYNAQDAVSDTKLAERKKNQLKEYFNSVLKAINQANQFVVFGPGETKSLFKNEVSQQHDIKDRLLGVQTADKMTTNQMVEWVRNYYKS